MKRAALLSVVIGLLLLCGVVPSYDVQAQSPTDTPTPTATLSNGDLIQLATPAAPSACGSVFTPCGALPWNIIVFPTVALRSPTPYPTVPTNTPIPATATPTNTPTLDPSITPTPTITPTPEFDFSEAETLTARMNGIALTLAAQSTQVIDVSGTPQSVGGIATQIGGRTIPFFSTVKGVAQVAGNSRALGVITFILLCLVFVLFVKIALFFLPMVLTFLNFVLQVIQSVKPF